MPYVSKTRYWYHVCLCNIYNMGIKDEFIIRGSHTSAAKLTDIFELAVNGGMPCLRRALGQATSSFSAKFMSFSQFGVEICGSHYC